MILSRRYFVSAIGATGIAMGQSPSAPGDLVVRKGRIKQRAMQGNFDPKISFDDMVAMRPGWAAKAWILFRRKTGLRFANTV